MKFAFNRSSGLDEAKAFLSQALDSGKFPHALLIHGPEGVGQNALLLDVIDLLLCDDAARRPCGTCPGCLGRKRNNLDNLIFMMPLEKKDKGSDKSGDTELEGAQAEELGERARELQADPYGFARPEKGNLDVGQIRSMQARIGFAEASRLPRLVVVLWAEAMQAPAANTLLKTLEEPPANTYFLLSSEDRSVLLPTILSRCTQLPLFPMLPAGLLSAVAAHGPAWGMEAPPERLIPFAEGSPGVLLRLHRNGGDTLLEEAGRFFSAALDGDWLAFSDYLEESDAFGDLASASRTCHFLLRAIRAYHRLETLEGPFPGPAAVENALLRQGLDPGLAAALGPLAIAPDLAALTALAAWIEETLSAVRAYAKPKVAALGLHLEYAARHPRGEARAC